MLGNMGISEWAIVLVIVLIFFGPKNLPKLAQSIGKSVRELKNGLSGIGDDLKDTLTTPPAETPKVKSEIKAEPESHPAINAEHPGEDTHTTTV